MWQRKIFANICQLPIFVRAYDYSCICSIYNLEQLASRHCFVTVIALFKPDFRVKQQKYLDHPHEQNGGRGTYPILG